jgi:hypothetical protein
MGVVAVRRSGTKVATPARRSRRMPTQYAAPSPSPRTLRADSVRAASVSPHWPADARKTFWERFADDRDLIRLKVVLLTSLALITVLLERVA